MKKLALTTLMTVAISASVNAHETHDKLVVFKGDKSYASFCRAVTEDNVRLIHNSFRNKVGIVAESRRDVYRKLLDTENLSCNGKNLVEFSKERAAAEVLAYLEKASKTL